MRVLRLFYLLVHLPVGVGLEEVTVVWLMRVAGRDLK